MPDSNTLITHFWQESARFWQELTWLSAFDILLVALLFFGLLLALRGTQAINLMRGVLLLTLTIFVLSGLLQLRAISWLLRSTLPALLFAIPVIFQPEIRRALGRLGRASTWLDWMPSQANYGDVFNDLVSACEHLSMRRTGALIVLERQVGLKEYIDTGVQLDAALSVELIEQIFYKDTPLHDGAVFIREKRIIAAACVLPLTKQETLNDRQLGLRHRAALGISEISDAVAIVVSEETGTISVVHNGQLIRHLDGGKLRNILAALTQPTRNTWQWWRKPTVR
jgi:diadenylate cyclase